MSESKPRKEDSVIAPQQQGPRDDDYSLVDFVLSGNIQLPREHRKQRQFFRKLRKLGSDDRFRSTVQQFRDSVIRSFLSRENQASGMAIAMAGPRGGEGTSLLSLLLALSLGACKHYRIAFLDGRFSPNRFAAISDMLALSRNACRVEKGASVLDGYYNTKHPNVYFLRSSGGEQSLEFFADKRLKGCLNELRQSFDFIIIDMPPLLQESSNIFLAREVDSLYMVASAGKTKLGDVDKCMQVASDVGREITGVIVNRQKAPLWTKLFWRDYFF